MDDGTNYWFLFAITFPWGLILFAGGILAYTNMVRGLLATDKSSVGRRSVSCIFLGLWIMLIAGVKFVENANDFILVPYTLVMILAQGIGMLTWLWTPRFLRPKWMKERDRLISRGGAPS